MNVLLTREIRDYIEDLVIVLYQKRYFSWLDSSETITQKHSIYSLSNQNKFRIFAKII